MSAKTYNEIRRTLFSTYHKGEEGRENAFQWLEQTYRKKLGARGYSGLKAELNFYNKYDKEFQLSVGGDMGDHVDFTGMIGNNQYRIDVTTNADYKKLKDYEPFQKHQNAKYKIIIATTSGEIDEIVDINFPFCPNCGQGRLIDIALLLPMNLNNHGESNWTNDQVLIGACNHCEYYEEQNRISTSFLFDFKTEIKNAIEAESDHLDYLASTGQKAEFDANKVIHQHSANVVPYLKNQFDKSIMALGERNYNVTNPSDGDGYFNTHILWRKKLKMLESYIYDQYEIDIL